MLAAPKARSTWRARRREPGLHPRARRRRLVWLVFGVWLGCCLSQLALACREARRATRDAVAVRRSIDVPDFDASQAEVRMEQVRRSFDLAHRHSSSPLLTPLRVLPVLGRQLHSFADLTLAASRVAAVGSATAEALGNTPRAPGPTGPDRVGMLRVLSERAVTARDALGQVQLGPRHGLLEPLRRNRALLERDLARARASLGTAGDALAGVAGVLEGPRRYLLLAANNAEMRAGSGMFLSIGTIQMSGGSVTVGRLHPSGELTLPEPGVSVEGELGTLWGWLQPGREWRNLATTPRFGVTAPLAAQMWERLTGEPVDGVLALDVPFLAEVLAATGPVEVGDGVVSEATVVDDLLRHQYQGLDVHDVQAPRRERLGAIATAVVGALEEGDYSPGRLVAGVGRASRGRHLLAWSSNPSDQRIWEKAGVAGSLQPTSLAVSILNRGGNKLDPFLDVEAALDLRPVADGTEATVRLRVANHTPEGQAPYIAGPYPGSGIGEGDYLGIVAVNLPGMARDIAVDGAGTLVAGGTDGPTQVVAASLLVARGQQTTIAVQFRLPPANASIEVIPSARVPATRWRAGGHRWSDDMPKVVSWRWE
jgi:hypothetical protein